MEEETIELCNIMPVELAIKRELEYRRKIEVLKNQHQNDLKQLILAQVSVSEGQTLVDPKRKAQPCNAQSSRALQSSRSCRFICVVCHISFATVFHLKIHGETFAHKAKVLKSKRGGANTSNPFLCEACDVLCSTSRVMQFHVAGIKHATYLQEFEDAKRERIYGNLAAN